jgi:putative membrane protein
MRYLAPASALLLLTFCSPRSDNQAGSESASNGAGGMSSHDTMPMAAPPSDTTSNPASTPAAILSQMNVANTTEIQLARMATKKASSPAVKQLAQKLVAEHTKNRQEVMALAKKMNVSLTPQSGGSVTPVDSAAVPSDLRTASGAQFDKAFVEQQISDHESNIQKIQSQMLPSVQDAQLKTYLQKTVSGMKGHLSSLQQTQKKLST